MMSFEYKEALRKMWLKERAPKPHEKPGLWSERDTRAALSESRPRVLWPRWTEADTRGFCSKNWPVRVHGCSAGLPGLLS